MTYKVKERQTIFDVALEACGAWTAAYAIAEKNNRSLTDDLVAGEVLELPAVVDSRVVEHFRQDGTSPATGITAEETSTLLYGGEGVDFWRIGFEFIIS